MRNSSWCLKQIIDDAAQLLKSKVRQFHTLVIWEKGHSFLSIRHFRVHSILNFFSASKCASSFSFMLKGELITTTKRRPLD